MTEIRQVRVPSEWVKPGCFVRSEDKWVKVKSVESEIGSMERAA